MPRTEWITDAVARHQVKLTIALIFVVTEGLALTLGLDGGWDTRNYHLYGPYALMNKSAWTDLFPAHMQTLFAPTLDIPIYLLSRAVTSGWVVNVYLALPHAVALSLVFTLACRLLQAADPVTRLVAAGATAIGGTGAAAANTLATAYSEMVPISLALSGLLLLIRPAADIVPAGRHFFWAGMLWGAACGLKLTFGYAAVALAGAVLFIPPGSGGRFLPRLVLLGVGGLVGAAATGGYWWLSLWQQFGNPVFPMYNDVFKSPFAPPGDYLHRLFRPHSLLEALAGPFIWSVRLVWSVSESRMRDPRMLLGLLAAIMCLALALKQRRQDWRPTFLAALFLLAFAMWRAQFSTYRYWGMFELLTGVLMVLAVWPLARGSRGRVTVLAGLILLSFPIGYVTVFPQTRRTEWGAPPLSVQMRPVARDALVLSLDAAPTAYLALFQDPAVRFVSLNSTFMALDRGHPLQKRAEEMIRRQTGEMWGLDTEIDYPGQRDATMAFYGLVATDCEQVRSALDDDRVRMCRLSRR